MADFIFERDHTVVIVLRVPRALWDRWEYRHQHFGKAIHALRESAIEIMGAGASRAAHVDRGDPFYKPRGV
jgi:hypothetical protein